MQNFSLGQCFTLVSTMNINIRKQLVTSERTFATMIDMGDGSVPIVIDNGSANTRAGFAGMAEPSVIVASAIGKQLGSSRKPDGDSMSYTVDSHEKILEYPPSRYEFRYMLRHGLVQDWNALEQLWHSCIYEKLRCVPEEHVFLVSESPFNTAENREQMAEIMFETFNVPGLYIGSQPILSLIASWGSLESHSNNLTGTVVDSGESATTIIPVADGYILRNCIQQIPLGGRDITSYVQGLLRKNQRNLRLSQSFEIARQIKEQYGYVSLDPEGERYRSFNTKASGKYGTSESWSCNIDEEMYLSGEVLFRPNLLRGSKSRLTALPDLVDSSIQMCPIDLRRELYGNIVLTSGSTRFHGMNSRLQRDVYNLANNRLKQCRSEATMDVNVVGQSSHSHSSWLGGSIVATDSNFYDWIMTREQYEEVGPTIARQSVGVSASDLGM